MMREIRTQAQIRPRPMTYGKASACSWEQSLGGLAGWVKKMRGLSKKKKYPKLVNTDNTMVIPGG